MLNYLLVIATSLVGVSLAGIIFSRHFVRVMLAIELIFMASSIALVSFFVYAQNPDPLAIAMLISIWSTAAVEVIALITFYMYMKSRGFDFDVVKLSRLKW